MRIEDFSPVQLVAAQQARKQRARRLARALMLVLKVSPSVPLGVLLGVPGVESEQALEQWVSLQIEDCDGQDDREALSALALQFELQVRTLTDVGQ